jgi:hypothetical protein
MTFVTLNKDKIDPVPFWIDTGNGEDDTAQKWCYLAVI